MNISVIIVNYNTKELLKKCLDSINKKDDYEFIVIDNNSKDNSVEVIKKEYPYVNLIRNNNNLGYAKAINQGIKVAKGEYILVLNSDIELINNAIDKMSNFMIKNTRCGCIGPKLLDGDKNTQQSFYKFPNLLWLPIHLFQIKHLLSRLGVRVKPQIPKALSVDWVLGCCMLIKKEIIDKIGLFDENFFLYFEEIDWQRRVKQNGYEIYYYPDAEAIHYLEQSSKQEKELCFIERYKSLFYYYKKYYGKLGSIYSKLLTITVFLIKIGLFALIYIITLKSKKNIEEKIRHYFKVIKYAFYESITACILTPVKNKYNKKN